MKRDNVKVLVLDTDGNFFEKVIKDDLDTFHALIKCETMQGLTCQRMGRVYVDLLIDDNGKLYGQDTITGVFINGKMQVLDVILGNIVFSWHDDDGDTCDIMEGTKQQAEKFICEGSALTAPLNGYKVAPQILVLMV